MSGTPETSVERRTRDGHDSLDLRRTLGRLGMRETRDGRSVSLLRHARSFRDGEGDVSEEGEERKAAGRNGAAAAEGGGEGWRTEASSSLG